MAAEVSNINDSNDIRIIDAGPNVIMFELWKSPKNNINFVKNKKFNTITKRKYVTAEVYTNDKIDKSIRDYMYTTYHVNSSKIAYISYIAITKIQLRSRKNTNNTKYKKTNFTIMNTTNTVHTAKRNIFYNKRNNQYTITKGYGKILLAFIESYMRKNGISYIILMPSNRELISYYTKHSYIECIINMPMNNINSNMPVNTPSVYMYKKL